MEDKHLEDKHVIVHISFQTMLRVAFLLLGVFFIFLIRDIIGIFVLAVILASAVDPLATLGERKGLPRILVVLLVYFSAVGTLTALLWFVIPQLARDVSDFAEHFPKYYQVFQQELVRYGAFEDGLVAANVEQALGQLAALVSRTAGNIPQLVSGIFGGLVSAMSVFLVSFYLAMRRNGVEQFLKVIVPNGDQTEPYVISLWHRAESKIGYWLRGQVILAIFIFLVVWIGLSIFGIRYSLLLALIAGAFEIVPLVGPIAAGLTAVAVAFLQDPLLAIVVAAFFIVVQQIEGNIIVPIVFRRILGLHPALVIFALLVGGRVAGPIGLLLAVPLAAVLIEFLNDINRGKVKL